MTGGDEAIMHGGVKFYRGSAAAARSYVAADHSRADDYYLAEGSGLAEHHVATVGNDRVRLERRPDLDGDGYERWVAGYDVATSWAKGRLRADENALRFVEVVVNGPKTWSLAAALHPEIAEAYDAAQSRAASEIIGWVAEHATTRVGPRGRQAQVPVEKIEAAVIRHYTSRAGDPHRHLHLQVNARVFAAGAWRGLHSVGVKDLIEAINGIGHAAIMCDPEFRAALAARGYTLDDAGEVRELSPFAGPFSERATQIARNAGRYEAEWRAAHPGQEPGPKLRRSWDRRAWADTRPDKVVPASGAELVARWNEELHDLGFHQPHQVAGVGSAPIGAIDRDVAVTVILSRLGAKRSAWNAADIRGETEKLIASIGIVAQRAARSELTEDITARAVELCRPLLNRGDVPEHIRSLTSEAVLQVEGDLNHRLAIRADRPVTPARQVRIPASLVDRLDPGQRRAVAALAGHAGLLVIEGAAGTGKTTTLAAARAALDAQDRRLVVVTPTLKAAQIAREQVGTDAFSAAWLAHQHGYLWDEDGHWTHHPTPRQQIRAEARLLPGDVLLVDEAGMLDQDTARALLAIADHAGAEVVFLGDRHQLPAVGRGGVLDLAARWAPDQARLELAAVHRFADPGYARLSLLMRVGEQSDEVFDQLVERGQIVLHPTEVERTAALSEASGLVIADTRDQVAALNAVLRDHHAAGASAGERSSERVTRAGERIGLGNRVATRRNDRDLGVANRETWTVAGIGEDGSLLVAGRVGQRLLPADYVREHVELAYATTVHGAQGETVDHAHFVVGETTGAAATYVAMTRGRHTNTAHMVAQDLHSARKQWVEVFSRDRADLGPAHAAQAAAEDIERYGSQAPARAPGSGTALQAAALQQPPRRRPRPPQPPPVGAPARGFGPGIGF